MWQPVPDVPHDVALSLNSAHWCSTPKVEEHLHGVDKTALRPVPLFRSVGLTGLSASLPPHRRLRSVLHRARAVQPANETGKSWPQAPSRSSDIVTSNASEKGLPFRPHIRSSSHVDSATQGSLPDIEKNKLGQPEPRQDIRPFRDGNDRDTITSSHAQTDKHVHLRPSISSKILNPAGTVHRNNNRSHNPPAKAHKRRPIISPSSQTDLSSSETVAPVERLAKRRERCRRSKINDTGGHGHSETLEKGQEDNICQWLSGLGITEREKEQRDHLKRSVRPVCGLGEKGTCPTRRDRRPHFLPPISQLDCLLNVPLVLPENSPPPSPSYVSSTPSFPLQVPTLPVWTEHRLKHT